MSQTTLFLMFGVIIFLMVSGLGYLYLFKFNPKKLSPEELQAKLFNELESTIFKLLEEVIKLAKKEESNLEVARNLSDAVYQKLASNESPYYVRRLIGLMTEDDFYNAYEHIFFKHVVNFRGKDTSNPHIKK